MQVYSVYELMGYNHDKENFIAIILTLVNGYNIKI